MRDQGGDSDAPAAERSLVLLGVGVLVLASPLRLLWARADAPWYTLFAVWIALVGLAVVAARARS